MTTRPYEDWEAAFWTNREYEAAMIRDVLENADIPAVIMARGSNIYGVNLGDLTRVPVLVPKDRLEDAKKALTQSVPSEAELEKLAMQARPPEGAPPDDKSAG